jgi:CBS domain-containing protein
MATVSHLLALKNSPHVFSVSPDSTVFEATRLMNTEHIGALLIIQNCTASHKLVGIFTERDVLRRVVAAKRQPEHTKVSDVMTREIITCTADTPLDGLAELLRVKRIRHLPVLHKNESIAGFISIGDLNAYQAGYCELALQEAENYIHGRV